MNTADLMRERLQSLQPLHCEIIDDSAAHSGHAGVQQTGGGHYLLNIVSDAFQDKPLLTRHRMIYSALADLMHRQIHALRITASTSTASTSASSASHS